MVDERFEAVHGAQPGAEADPALVEQVAREQMDAACGVGTWAATSEYFRTVQRTCARAAIAALQGKADAVREAGRQAGLVALADTLQREVDTHIHENWMYDGETGSWDTRNEASRDWVSDREELIERIRALAQPGGEAAP